MTTPPPPSAPHTGLSPRPSLAPLADRIVQIALLRGTFTLRSGQTSSFYLDKFRILTHPGLLTDVAHALGQRIATLETELSLRFDRLAGSELGGVPLATAVGLATGRPYVFVRNSKKDYGTAQQIEGVFTPGERVLFLEDVITTGGQSVEAIRTLRDAGLIVPAVLATIDREQGGADAVRAQGVAFAALLGRSILGLDTLR